jgi:uncharacterized membrane protein
VVGGFSSLDFEHVARLKDCEREADFGTKLRRLADNRFYESQILLSLQMNLSVVVIHYFAEVRNYCLFTVLLYSYFYTLINKFFTAFSLAKSCNLNVIVTRYLIALRNYRFFFCGFGGSVFLPTQ